MSPYRTPATGTATPRSTLSLLLSDLDVTARRMALLKGGMEEQRRMTRQMCWLINFTIACILVSIVINVIRAWQ